MSRHTGLTTQKNYRLLLFVYSFVIVVLGVLLAGWGVLWSLPDSLGEGYHNVQAMLREIQNILIWRIGLLYAVTTVLVVIALAVLHLLYSHRIAGPVHRIGLEAAKIAQGNLTGNIKFRHHDNLMDMSDSMNDVAFRFREHVSKVQASLAVIEEQSLRIKELVQQEKDGVAMKEAAAKIARCDAAIAATLAEIRI